VSILNLPEPANWSKAGARLVVAGIVVLAGLVYFLVRGILAGLRGNLLTTVLVLGIVTFPVLMMAALALAATGKTQLRTSGDATGFTVFPDKRFSMLYFTGMAVLAPSAILFAVFVPQGAIDIPMSRGMQVFSPVLFVTAAVIAIGALILGVRREGVGYLRFTPSAIEIADVLKTREVEWDDIVDVRDHSDTKDGNKTGRSVVLCLRNGGEAVIGALNMYVPTGVPLYWMVRHYWRHPEDRAELRDSRALDRLRAGRFDLG